MRRGLWFVAGAASGVYALTKARRAAEALTPGGMQDRLAGLSLGAHLLGDEVRTGMVAKENDLRARLGLALDGPKELAAAPAPEQQATPQPGTTHALSREGIS